MSEQQKQKELIKDLYWTIIGLGALFIVLALIGLLLLGGGR